jgi:hypothetical protein
MRKLAHIEIIKDIQPIPKADKIEVATVLGWECVVKKGEFNIGDKIIYIEVDSIVPEKPEFEFLRDKKFRIRTIKLKKQISQGLIVPISYLLTDSGKLGEHQDVTEWMGITKYLSPSEQTELQREVDKIKFEKNKFKKFMMRYSWFRRLFLSKKGKSGFPYWVSKTDEERIQNLNYDKILEYLGDKEVYVTEKIDYQSATFTGKLVKRWKYLPFKKYQFVVCSRNLINNDKNSLYWRITEKYNLKQILKENPTLTIQGEQGNTKVQGNKYGIKEPTMWVFNIIDHEKKYHYNYSEIITFCKKYKLNIVSQVTDYCNLSEIGSTVQEVIEFSKGKSIINPKIEREGIVIRCIENGKKLLSFKVINPNFLLKYE